MQNKPGHANVLNLQDLHSTDIIQLFSDYLCLGTTVVWNFGRVRSKQEPMAVYAFP